MLKTREQIERAHKLAEEEGLSLRDLGERYKLSHERIRQIFEDAGLPPVNATEVRRAHLEREAWSRKEEVFDSYRRHGSIERVAEEMGLPATLISNIVAKMPLRNAYSRHRTRGRIRQAQIRADRKFSNEDCLDAIRLCARDLGRAPSYAEYRSWQRNHKGAPSGPTIRSRGLWSEAIIKALG